VCLPGPAVDVVMTPNVKFVEVLVRNCFVVSCGIHSFAGRNFAGEVESSGDCGKIVGENLV
jgi:hypothetical protein